MAFGFLGTRLSISRVGPSWVGLAASEEHSADGTELEGCRSGAGGVAPRLARAEALVQATPKLSHPSSSSPPKSASATSPSLLLVFPLVPPLFAPGLDHGTWGVLVRVRLLAGYRETGTTGPLETMPTAGANVIPLHFHAGAVSVGAGRHGRSRNARTSSNLRFTIEHIEGTCSTGGP